jgi:hemerythrin
MKDLIWDNTLSVDVPEIDEDHRKLVDLFNLLNHAVAAGEAKAYVEAVMEELVSCTLWHFRHEERLMLKYGYAGLAEHRSEHEELIASAKLLQQQCLQQGETAASSAISSAEIEHLEHWLTGHIYGADMDLGAFLSQVM